MAKKSIKFPTPYTVLLIVIAFSVALTYLLPAGVYDTLAYDAQKNVFLLENQQGTTELPATEQTLQQNGIIIPLENFVSGKIKKPVSVPNTYREIQAEPQPLSQLILAPILGIYQAVDIILFVLILGGFVGVFNSSGTLNKGVGYLAHRLKGREEILIVVVCTLIALGGTSFGLAEETLAFYPMLVPVFLAAGYDLMVPLAVIYLGSAVGTMASTVNPFAVIIASDAVGVDWTAGLGVRLFMLILCTFIAILYIIRYAKKVKKFPEKSLVYGVPIPEVYQTQSAVVHCLSLSEKIQLCVFAGSFILMIIGVSFWGWWFEQMTALFLVSAVIISVLQRVSEKEFVSHFLQGAQELLGVAFIIGIARGVTYVLDNGQISDTILFHFSQLISGMSPMVFLPTLLLIFGALSLFIASSSGMAVVTMPIMGAIAVVVGIQGQSVVNAYLFGMGIMSILTPTGLILPSLAMVNLNYKQWLKFSLPLMLILLIASVLMLWVEYLFL